MPINCMGSPRTEKKGSDVDVAGSAEAFQDATDDRDKTVSHGAFPFLVVQNHTVSMCHVLHAAQYGYIR
ncbi:hypothetical protein [Paraburkholderia unamae]|uniref:hypothetical protein n=1 Tax=Paraburkholderia unamae TaxID=219649 RepID=UPI001057AC11|nr:hypothetical protein [Paraburkholderia unamae]